MSYGQFPDWVLWQCFVGYDTVYPVQSEKLWKSFFVVPWLAPAIIITGLCKEKKIEPSYKLNCRFYCLCLPPLFQSAVVLGTLHTCWVGSSKKFGLHLVHNEVERHQIVPSFCSNFFPSENFHFSPFFLFLLWIICGLFPPPFQYRLSGFSLFFFLPNWAWQKGLFFFMQDSPPLLFEKVRNLLLLPLFLSQKKIVVFVLFLSSSLLSLSSLPSPVIKNASWIHHRMRGGRGGEREEIIRGGGWRAGHSFGMLEERATRPDAWRNPPLSGRFSEGSKTRLKSTQLPTLYNYNSKAREKKTIGVLHYTDWRSDLHLASTWRQKCLVG